MSKKVSITCKNPSLHGKSMNLPDIGEVELSESGEVEVPQELAEQLVAIQTDWKYTHEEEVEEVEENSAENTENSDEETSDDGELDKSLRKALIKNFTGPDAEKELKKLASDSGVSKTVIGKAKSKVDLINMLINRLSSEDKKAMVEQLTSNE